MRLDAILRAAELRAIEAADERCAAYPRVKARDDATAVLVEWRRGAEADLLPQTAS